MDEVGIHGKEMEKSGYRQLFGSGCKEKEGASIWGICGIRRIVGCVHFLAC